MPSWETLIKPSLDLLKSGLDLAKKKNAATKYERLLSQIVRELLKGDPDFDLVEARWGELQQLDVLPSRTFIRAKKLYAAARAHRGIKSTPAPPKAARRPAAKPPACKKH
jgi:hypothetical protein